MKNIILITIDSLRADHIGCLGYDKKLTPNLDKLAKDGVLFTQAFSYGPTTFASIPPLLTSTPMIPYYNCFSNNKHEIKNLNGGLKKYKELTTNLFKLKPTIANSLQRCGYDTAAFHSNPYLSRYYGYGMDFSHFDDTYGKYGFMKRIREKIKIILVSEKIDHFIKRLYFLLTRDEIPFERAIKINTKAISWLKKKKPNFFFIWLHYMDTHVPYKPPGKFRTEIGDLKTSELNRILLSNEEISESELSQIVELYDGCIKYVDQSINSLLNELDDMELLKNTIVVITADHGEEFRDHGGFLHIETKLYDELIHVPLIIYSTEYQNITIDEPVSLIDIAPTIMDMLNLNKVKSFQGKSLIPIINGEKSTGIISQGGIHEMGKDLRMIIAYRTKRWKYILDKIRGKEELYDIKDDPEETKNLNTINMKVTQELRSFILEHMSNQYKQIDNDLKKEKIKGKIQKLKVAKTI